MEFVRGVRMSDDYAKEVKEVAQKLDIALSSHAPYYVNLCSKDEKIITNTKKHIIKSAHATYLAGGSITVFHPGYYQKLSPEEAYIASKNVLTEIQSELEQEGIKVRLGAENVGKKSAFGSLEENIRLSQELEMVEPCIDFAHLHARGDVRIKGEDDYKAIFEKLERELGDYVKRFHCHFSEIEYSEKGERSHMPLGSANEPPYKPLMKMLAENGYSGTIICESPQIDIDAAKMKKEYERLRRRR
jgi:deoxyribonuclease-4